MRVWLCKHIGKMKAAKKCLPVWVLDGKSHITVKTATTTTHVTNFNYASYCYRPQLKPLVYIQLYTECDTMHPDMGNISHTASSQTVTLFKLQFVWKFVQCERCEFSNQSEICPADYSKWHEPYIFTYINYHNLGIKWRKHAEIKSESISRGQRERQR